MCTGTSDETGEVLSSVSIESVGNGSDGEEANTSLWVATDSYCTASGLLMSYSSGFFIPTLTHSQELRSEGEDDDSLLLVFIGELLIPCDFTFTLSLDGIEYSSSLTSVNETYAYVLLDDDRLEDFDESYLVTVALTYTYQNISHNTSVITLKEVDESELKQQRKERNTLIYVFVGIVSFIVVVGVVTIVILLIKVRKFKKLAYPNLVDAPEL